MNFRKNNIVRFVIILSAILVNSSAFAGWPLFSYPDKQYLLEHHLIDTSHCPSGKGRLVVAEIPIDPFCKSRCPSSWAWKSVTDNLCHDLATNFNFQNYDIQHYQDEDGTTLYSVVTANYGKNTYSANKFVYTSPKEHWFCITESPNQTVTCANDI